jgi:hypothetical protein
MKENIENESSVFHSVFLYSLLSHYKYHISIQ